MNNEIYEKMTDDEKRQFICNCEGKAERAEEYAYVLRDLSHSYEHLLSEIQCANDVHWQLTQAQKKYNEFAMQMYEKYSISSKSTATDKKGNSLQPMEC